MADPPPPADATLAVATRVAEILDELGAPSALIGAGALAVYGYPRATADLDLGVATDPFTTLRAAQHRVATELQLEVRLVLPDADDPLGGVLTASGPHIDPVQVVNFVNPLGRGRGPGREAVATAVAGLIRGSSLRVVDVAHLVALKLYAGGYKSRLDVLELLARNPQEPRPEIAAVCAKFGLAEAFDAILQALQA